MIPRMPFNNLVGIRLKAVHRDGVTIQCETRPELLNGAGVVHGGVTATLADAAVGISLARHFGGRRPITTVEFKINYFRPVSSGKIYARGILLRIGSAICVGRVDMTDDRKALIASALVTYMLLDSKAAPAK